MDQIEYVARSISANHGNDPDDWERHRETASLAIRAMAEWMTWTARRKTSNSTKSDFGML